MAGTRSDGATAQAVAALVLDPGPDRGVVVAGPGREAALGRGRGAGAAGGVGDAAETHADRFGWTSTAHQRGPTTG